MLESKFADGTRKTGLHFIESKNDIVLAAIVSERRDVGGRIENGAPSLEALQHYAGDIDGGINAETCELGQALFQKFCATAIAERPRIGKRQMVNFRAIASHPCRIRRSPAHKLRAKRLTVETSLDTDNPEPAFGALFACQSNKLQRSLGRLGSRRNEKRFLKRRGRKIHKTFAIVRAKLGGIGVAMQKLVIDRVFKSLAQAFVGVTNIGHENR